MESEELVVGLQTALVKLGSDRNRERSRKGWILCWGWKRCHRLWGWGVGFGKGPRGKGGMEREKRRFWLAAGPRGCRK